MNVLPVHTVRGSALRVVTALTSLLVLTSCTREPESAPATTPPQVAAETLTVHSGTFAEDVPANGLVVAAPGSSAALSAPAVARVSRVFVAVGDRVRVGDPLVAFDPTLFDGELSRASAAVRLATQNRDRARRLTDAGIAPRKELEQAAATLADAEAQMAVAKRAQGLATLRAPVSGVVARVSVVRDESVDPSRTVVEVVDPQRLELIFGVSPRSAAMVRVGSPVAISSGSRESLGAGRVIAVGSTVDTLSRNVTVRVVVTRAERALRIGEAVSARIAGPSRTNVIAIPTAALVPDGERFHVFIVDAQGLAHAREVTVLSQTESSAQITKGLAAGDIIVTAGAFGVDDGVKIVVRR